MCTGVNSGPGGLFPGQGLIKRFILPVNPLQTTKSAVKVLNPKSNSRQRAQAFAAGLPGPAQSLLGQTDESKFPENRRSLLGS
jgi:hypothetical protein